jgi:hypothetical protein
MGHAIFANYFHAVHFHASRGRMMEMTLCVTLKLHISRKLRAVLL